MFKTNPDHAAAIERLYQALVKIKIGETLAYLALSRAAGTGYNVQKKARHLLDRARERAEKDLGCIFESVRGIGVTRLPYDRAPDVGLQSIRRIRKAARRGQRRLSRLNGNSMTDADQRRVIGHTAMLGAIALVADGRRATAIAAVADPAKPIPPQNILDMFRGGI